MAKKTKDKEEPKKVRCEDCRFAVRDTSGISRNVFTGVYFMGHCSRGLATDGKDKNFMDHLRTCGGFRERIQR